MKLNKDLLSEIFLYCDCKTLKSLKKLFSTKYQDLDKNLKSKLINKTKLMILNSDLSEEFIKFDDYSIDKNCYGATSIKFINNKEVNFSIRKSSNSIIIYTSGFSTTPFNKVVFTKIYNLII